jgi:hypothetical protein
LEDAAKRPEGIIYDKKTKSETVSRKSITDRVSVARLVGRLRAVNIRFSCNIGDTGYQGNWAGRIFVQHQMGVTSATRLSHTSFHIDFCLRYGGAILGRTLLFTAVYRPNARRIQSGGS